jgi:formylglycine-generating enzyme required for sulfatase activity
MDIEFVEIEGAAFRMGSDPHDIDAIQQQFACAFARFDAANVREWLLKQTPSFQAEVAPFAMSRNLVTRGQFAAFEQAVEGVASPLTRGDPELPVEGLSFEQACSFCEWLSEVRAERIALPSEAEWEFAASSGGRFAYPWGDAWDPGKANTAEAGPGRASKAGEYPQGRSLHGVEDLAGNLEEWTSTPYRPYPGGPLVRDHIFNEQGPGYPVLRGGSYALNGDLCLAARRHGFRQGWAITGLRIVRRPFPKSA